MADKLNPSIFYPYNVVDTCGIWNILSSQLLFSGASSRCKFCCTNYVYYECLIKPRANVSTVEEELKQRLLKVRKGGKQFADYHLDLEDLQEINILQKRKNLGKGEISSIVFAKKTRQAYLTDDMGARKLAESIMDKNAVQTTPHLFGWLFYENILTDADKKQIIDDHSKFRTTKWGNLSSYFEIMYTRAFEYRLMHMHPRGGSTIDDTEPSD